MNRYEFGNVVFTPTSATKLKIDGEPVHLQNKLAKLLEFMLDNAGQTIPINAILDGVWGKGEHTQNAFNVALNDLHKVLPKHIRIKNIHRQGYVFDYQLKTTQWRYEKLEEDLANSPKLNRYIGIGLFGFCLLAISALAFSTNYLYQQFSKLHYVITNMQPLFTWDYTAGKPQISPAGDAIAYRLSSDRFNQEYLGFIYLPLGDTKRVVPMGFDDGFKWDLTGRRIVYQDRTTGSCEIRLLTFSHIKLPPQNELLTHCSKNSGSLSFAWFNDNEFYVNFTDTDKIITPNGLPLHHLYSFNINTRERKKLKTATYQGGVGFYSLDYDPTTKILYFLQSHNFQTTDITAYQNNKITTLRTVDYRLAYFTADNDTLIYKNQQGEFVINAPASDFNNPQILLRPQYTPLFAPQLNKQQLTYVVGDNYDYSLHRLQANTLERIDTQNVRPDAMADYDGKLIFTSRQTGVNQLYLKELTGDIIKISDMQTDEHITYMDIAGDIAVISYLDRVDIYQLGTRQISLVNSLPNFKYGVINASGDKLLLTTSDKQGNSQIVEKYIANLKPTGLVLTEVKLAFYHHDKIVYVKTDNVMMSINGSIHQPITNDVKVGTIVNTDVQNDEFYYITRHNPKNRLVKLNLTTGNKTVIPTGDLNPTKIQNVGNALYIRTRDDLQPTLMIGDLMITE